MCNVCFSALLGKHLQKEGIGFVSKIWKTGAGHSSFRLRDCDSVPAVSDFIHCHQGGRSRPHFLPAEAGGHPQDPFPDSEIPHHENVHAPRCTNPSAPESGAVYRPGLTGWAQINGRDELPIDVKARLDGEYARKLSFAFDCRCFFGTILAVLKHDGVVEGGTGALAEKERKS